MSENYYYKQTEHNPDLFTVGFGEGVNWTTDSDHSTREAAAARVRFLNGGDDSELEALREEVRELRREKLRIFKAFCCADSTLRIHYAMDMRSEAEKEEAEILRAYIAGDAPKDKGW